MAVPAASPTSVGVGLAERRELRQRDPGQAEEAAAEGPEAKRRERDEAPARRLDRLRAARQRGLAQARRVVDVMVVCKGVVVIELGHVVVIDLVIGLVPARVDVLAEPGERGEADEHAADDETHEICGEHGGIIVFGARASTPSLISDARGASLIKGRA